MLPLLLLPDSPFAEPLPSPLKISTASQAGYSFTKILIDAMALARETEHDQFWYLEQRLRSWAPMVSRSELEAVVKKPIVAVHGTRGKSTVHAAGEEPSSVKYRLHYCMMTRFVLLTLRAPFATTRTSSGGGVYETRYGKWDDAWKDAHDLVESASALHEHFDDFAKGNGFISLATFAATVSLAHPNLSCTTDLLYSTTAPLLHLHPSLSMVTFHRTGQDRSHASDRHVPRRQPFRPSRR